METPEKIIKTRLLFGIVGSLLFIFLGGWLFYKAEHQTALDPNIVEIIGIVAIAFFGIAALIGIKKFFSKNL